MSDVAVMRRTLEQVLAHPEAHGQGNWVCRTSACWAGWTVLLHRQLTPAKFWINFGGWTWTDPRNGNVYESHSAVSAEAQFLLGLTDKETDALFIGAVNYFGDTAEAEAVAVAEAIIARDESRLTDEQRALLFGEDLPVDPQPNPVRPVDGAGVGHCHSRRRVMADIEAEVRAHFDNDTAGHQLTILHDDGLYRHLRFKQPGTSIGYFDLITWPWNLTVGGDRDSYTFRRVEDMFGFFRTNGNSNGINPGYWAQKAVHVGRYESCRAYSEDKFRALAAADLAEAEDEWPGVTAAWAAHVDADDHWWGSYDARFEPSARGALDEFKYTPDEKQPAKFWSFGETYEWDLTDWDWHFLWSCHAIRWGIRQYDAAGTGGAP